MTSSQDSDLLKIREMGGNDLANIREIATRIYDKKLKSFLVLETKEQVLTSCQQLLINKTVDYMNVITELETGQLKSLNTLDELLGEKGNMIGNLNLSLAELRQTNREQAIAIDTMNKEIEVLKRDLSDTRTRLQIEQKAHARSTQESERKTNLLRNEYYGVKSSLQAQNKQLTKNLEDKMQQIRGLIASFKAETTTMKISKQKEMSQVTRRHKDAIAAYERDNQELIKDKKYLQDLLEVKEDELQEAKKVKPVSKITINRRLLFQRCGQFQITIRPTEAESNPSTARGKNQKLKKGEKVQRTEKKDSGAQTTETRVNQLPPVPKPTTAEQTTQTMRENPLQNSQQTQLQRQLKHYYEEKYRSIYDDQLRQIKKKYKEEYKNALAQAKTALFELSALTNEQIKLANTKFLEMEQVYDLRPSRQEDLEYIRELLDENRSLAALCSQANQKTDSAYMALKQYHSKLQSYKKLVPININGSVPPQIQQLHSTKSMRSHSIKNIKSANNTSWGMGFNSEPASSRKINIKTGKCQDETFDATKDILITDFDTSDMNSPLRKKTLLTRPQTGNILSLRKRSNHN